MNSIVHSHFAPIYWSIAKLHTVETSCMARYSYPNPDLHALHLSFPSEPWARHSNPKRSDENLRRKLFLWCKIMLRHLHAGCKDNLGPMIIPRRTSIWNTDSNNGKANVPSWQLSNPHEHGLPITTHKTYFKASIIYLSDKSLLCCISSHRKSHYVLRACSALLVAKDIFISYTVHPIPIAPHILHTSIPEPFPTDSHLLKILAPKHRSK